jgi:hypothetical protein
MGHPAGDEKEIRRLEDGLRGRSGGTGVPARGDVYWQNLIVRTNARIDRVASGKGITISWAARVAVPGVVALISFLIALHYYGPDNPSVTPLPVVVETLPASTIDSLVTSGIGQGEREVLEDALAQDLFTVGGEMAAEYLIATTPVHSLVDSLGDQEVTELLALLASGSP